MDNQKIQRRAFEFIHRTSQSILALQSQTHEDNFSRATYAIAECHSKIITTGIGKAGHVARKMASTLCSLSIPSVYLHPGEASHGDSGIITPNDVLIAFSTSGKTREVIEVAQLAKTLGVKCNIAVTSHPDAPLRSVCDIEVNMGLVQEAGHLEIAPTTSITVMLVIADMLAVIAAEIKGVTLQDYAVRHHSGYLAEACKERLER